jgi:peptidoglycan DL-endopeptidase CwlO
MAEHRARHGSESGAIRAADLLARFDSGARAPGRRHRAGAALGPVLATPGGSLAALTGPALALPRLPSMPSADTGRTLIAAVSTGAIGVTAAIVATAGPADLGPQQPTPQQQAGVQLAAQPGPVNPAAAAFTLPGARTAEPAAATAPVTGAELAAAAQPSAAPAPATAEAPAAEAPATRTPVEAAPSADAADAADAAAKAEAKAAAKAAEIAAADAAAKKAKDAEKKEADPKPGAGSSAGLKALGFAKGEIGTPYRYGATGPSAYDCSGLVMAAFKKAGVSMPRTSAAQSKVGTPVSRDELKAGDLVFFYSPVSHVGIYIGGGKMVHASTSGEPVKISDIGRRPFHNARRV